MIKPSSILLLMLLTVAQAYAQPSQGKITAIIGSAGDSHVGCYLRISVTNNTDQILTDFNLYGNALLFDTDSIFLSHGSGFGVDDKNQLYLGDEKIFKPGVTILAKGRIDYGYSSTSICSEISTVEFNLKSSRCKNRRGENLECDALLEKSVMTYKMSDLMNFDW
jgi:hypothetical protein